MKKAIRTTLTLLVCMATNLAAAHPGPHNHAGIAHDNPHAWLGWEAALLLAVIACAILLWRGRDRQR